MIRARSDHNEISKSLSNAGEREVVVDERLDWQQNRLMTSSVRAVCTVASENLLHEVDNQLVSVRREDKPDFIITKYQLVTAAGVLVFL